MGAKYGLRVGELKGRVGGEWLDSRAQLIALRTDLHLVKEWDAVAEWRSLSVREAKDDRTGFLVGVYRHRGFFINALATF